MIRWICLWQTDLLDLDHLVGIAIHGHVEGRHGEAALLCSLSFSLAPLLLVNLPPHITSQHMVRKFDGQQDATMCEMTLSGSHLIATYVRRCGGRRRTLVGRWAGSIGELAASRLPCLQLSCKPPPCLSTTTSPWFSCFGLEIGRYMFVTRNLKANGKQKKMDSVSRLPCLQLSCPQTSCTQHPCSSAGPFGKFERT